MVGFGLAICDGMISLETNKTWNFIYDENNIINGFYDMEVCIIIHELIYFYFSCDFCLLCHVD